MNAARVVLWFGSSTETNPHIDWRRVWFLSA